MTPLSFGKEEKFYLKDWTILYCLYRRRHIFILKQLLIFVLEKKKGPDALLKNLNADTREIVKQLRAL